MNKKINPVNILDFPNEYLFLIKYSFNLFNINKNVNTLDSEYILIAKQFFTTILESIYRTSDKASIITIFFQRWYNPDYENKYCNNSYRNPYPDIHKIFKFWCVFSFLLHAKSAFLFRTWSIALYIVLSSFYSSRLFSANISFCTWIMPIRVSGILS